MLGNHHLFRKSLCLVLTLAFLALSAGCNAPSATIGTSQENSDLPESTTVDTISATQPENTEETLLVQDKFILLREVYDLLSGPLGKPYLTPEYWGGEEIDIMKVADNYLIGLRDVDYQMHYLLYLREENSIIEIDTQGKHIAWDSISVSDNSQKLSFYYYEKGTQGEDLRGTIRYFIPTKAYLHEPPSKILFAKLDDYFKIPQPEQEVPSSASDFEILNDLYHELQKLYWVPSYDWGNFSEENICILHQDDYALVRLRGHGYTFCLYRDNGDISAVVPLDVPTVPWEVIRFQQNPGYLAFPCLSGNFYEDPYSKNNFPYTYIVDLKNLHLSYDQLYPLLNEEKVQTFYLGYTGCRSTWEGYHCWNGQRSFSLGLMEDTESTCDCDPVYPEIRVETNPNRTVSVWVKNMLLSEELKDQLVSMQMEGIENVQIKESSLFQETSVFNDSAETKEGTEIRFTAQDGYLLFGYLDSMYDYERSHLSFQMHKYYLTFRVEPVSKYPKPYYTISNYDYPQWETYQKTILSRMDSLPEDYHTETFADFSLFLPASYSVKGNEIYTQKSSLPIARVLPSQAITDPEAPFAVYDEQYAGCEQRKLGPANGHEWKCYHIREIYPDGSKKNTFVYFIHLGEKMAVMEFYPPNTPWLTQECENFEAAFRCITKK